MKDGYPEKKFGMNGGNFDILKREMLEDPETTLAEVGYMGDNLPIEFELCLRMRQKNIKEVFWEDKKVDFFTLAINARHTSPSQCRSKNQD